MADDASTTWDCLWHLQERLKQERLFVNKEKAEISNLNLDIQSTCERLYHLSWITRQQWKVVQRVRASPEECSQVVNRLDSARFVDASRHLGYLESKYWEFFKGLRENPSLVASNLAYADKINLDTSHLIRLLLNSLYGNCLLPRDESYVLRLMKHLIELKTTGDDSPEKFLQHRRNSFTSLFGILVESLFSAKLYLTAALHAPIMQVLSEDSLLQKRLPLKCTKFVENLKAKLYCFPQSLRWLICQFANILSSHGMEDKEVRSMVLNLLFDCLVCPAIIRPEQFGITSDVQISEIASQNLQSIASCLQSLHSHLYSSEGEDARNLDMFSRIDPICVTSFLDAILENQKDTQDFPNHKSPPGLSRNSVLITENELYALTSFLRMVQYSEDYRGIVNHKELEELLYPLPPQPEISPVGPIVDPPTQLNSEFLTESPKMPKRKRAFKGKKEEKPQKQSLGEIQVGEFEGKILKQGNTLQVESKSEVFKREFLQRIPLMLREDEEVLVISLGYSGIECPGLLSEEKVLGIKKPSKIEAERTKSYRPRSSSSQFSKHIFSDKSVAKKGKQGCYKDKSDDKEISTHHNDKELSSAPQQIIAGFDNQESSADLSKCDASEKTGTDPVDLLLSNSNSTAHAKPDVLEGGASKMQDSASVDLIDFESESPQPLSPVLPGNFTENPPVEKQFALAFENHAAGNRDSAISSSGSTRISSISTASTRSSGVEFTKENIFVDSGNGDILEENYNVNLSGMDPPDAPPDGFRKRSIVLSDKEKRDSRLSNRESTSSSTLTGFYGEGSNRDSQASFLSFDSEFPPQSGSSSTADDEHEAPVPREKKGSRAASLKRHFRSRKKTKGKGSFSGPHDVESDEHSVKKKEGFFEKIRTVRENRKSKMSGGKVFEKLAEKTLDSFDINKRMAHPEMEEKTPKDIENVIKKYTDIARSTAEEGKLVVADGGDDGDDDDDENNEEDDDIVDEEEKFENSKKKLRLVLCQADFQNLPMVHSENRMPEKSVSGKSQSQELLTFLHVQLAEAINLQDRALSAQLHETIRSVKDLPPQSLARLLESLQEDYKARAPYLAYLVNAHQGLLATHSHLERLVERVERDKIICRTYFTTSCVKLFLESKEKGEINKFTQDFQSLPTPDEKCALLEEFLETLGEEMEKHPIWSGVSEEQFQDSLVAIERAIMSSIYISAFYPFGGVDQQIDSTFHEHVINLKKVIHPNHKAVRVPKMYRKEAPWESAQKELLAINAYKTPTDKLKCVKRCCVTIMNLLCLASETSVPGADEFVPALVYVVIHANPEGLLSTMQYVNNFYDKRLSGEEAYYWMQFCAAIAFIKTLRYGSN